MSTHTRHRRRSWQQIGLKATTGVLIAADAAATIQAHNGLVRLSTLALGVISGALIVSACAALCSIAWHKGRHRYLVHAVACTPLRRPLYPIGAEPSANPNDAVALHYATTADRWRHNGNDSDRRKLGLDAITGPRPFLDAATDPADAHAGAAL